MNTKIINTLKQLETEKNITILYASETGSKAWGFPSPDSDFDIRFIYKHEKDWYISLNEKKDNIEHMFDDGNLDLNGWDIKKGLNLLLKSNAAFIERFTSPIKYINAPNFEAEILELIGKNYNRIAIFYHHYSLAKNFWESINNLEFLKLKSLFYLIRSLLSCKFVIENNTIAPMQISGLMLNLEAPITLAITELIAIKANESEKYLHPKNELVNNWILETFAYCEKNKDSIPTAKNDFASLDNYFKKILA